MPNFNFSEKDLGPVWERVWENLVTNLVEPHNKLSIDILKQRFSNTYRLCNNNIGKFKLFLRILNYY